MSAPLELAYAGCGPALPAGRVPSNAHLSNCRFGDIAIGHTASLARTVTEDDLRRFAVVSGDVNPTHLDTAYARTDHFGHLVAHGLWSAGLISTLLGTRLPGAGTIYGRAAEVAP